MFWMFYFLTRKLECRREVSRRDGILFYLRGKHSRCKSAMSKEKDCALIWWFWQSGIYGSVSVLCFYFFVMFVVSCKSACKAGHNLTLRKISKLMKKKETNTVVLLLLYLLIMFYWINWFKGYDPQNIYLFIYLFRLASYIFFCLIMFGGFFFFFLLSSLLSKYHHYHHYHHHH